MHVTPVHVMPVHVTSAHVIPGSLVGFGMDAQYRVWGTASRVPLPGSSVCVPFSWKNSLFEYPKALCRTSANRRAPQWASRSPGTLLPTHQQCHLGGGPKGMLGSKGPATPLGSYPTWYILKKLL